MFQIKNFSSIMASMINNATLLSDNLTDFNVGAVGRTLMEPVAREIEQFYEMLLEGLFEAIPVAIYKSFSFGKLAATPSQGYVTFNRDSTVVPAVNITIPAGTQLTASGNNSLGWVTVSDATLLAADSSINVFVTCTTVGTVGNVPAGFIDTLPIPILGISSVSNAAMFTTGTDQETSIQRWARFQRFVRSLSRGICEACEYGAEQVTITNSDGWVIEQVVSALVYDLSVSGSPTTPGYIDVYIWNGVNGASAALINAVQQALLGYIDANGNKIAGWKAAGVIATVSAVSITSVPVTAAITLAAGADWTTVQAAATIAINNYFSSLQIGDTCRYAVLIDAIMNVPGVIDVSMTAPTANTVPPYNGICQQGAITLTQAS